MSQSTSQSGELPPSQHHTLAIQDTHFLGPDGLPRTHYTRQRIRALAAIDQIPYRFDTNVVQVRMMSGDEASDVYEAAPGIYAVNLMLGATLEPGQETEVAYSTHFNYTVPPDPLFRRAVSARPMASLGISVVFDEHRLPVQVVQADWDGYQADSPIAAQRPVDIAPLSDVPGGPLGVHLSLQNVRNRVVGFQWEWPA